MPFLVMCGFIFPSLGLVRFAFQKESGYRYSESDVVTIKC